MASGEILADIILRGDREFRSGMERSKDSVEDFGDAAGDVQGPTDGASRSVDNLGDQADQTGGKISGLRQKMGGLQDKMKGMGRRMQGLGQSMSMFVTAPIVGAGAASIKLASDVEEMQSKMGVVFGDLTSDIQEWSEVQAEATNRSAIQYQKMATSLQDTFVPMGFARKEAAGMSKELTSLSVDLASFNNMSESEAMERLQSGLIGNHEALRQFGVMINQATLEQELMNQGIEGGIQAATEQEKVMARMAIIMRNTSDAQGDAARTSDSFANQMRGLKAQMEEVAVTIGQDLMPMAKDLISFVKVGIDWFSGLSEEQRKLGIALAGAAAAAGPLLFVLGSLAVVVGSLSAPIIAVVLAISAIIAIVIAFRDELAPLFSALQQLSSWFMERLPGAVKEGQSGLQAFMEFMQPVMDAIRPLIQLLAVEFIQTLKHLANVTRDTLAMMQQWWQENGQGILNVVMPIARIIRTVITQMMDAIITAVRVGLALLRGDWSGAWDIIKGYASRTWERIKSIVTDGLDAVTNFIHGYGETLYNAGRGLLDKFVDGIKSMASAPVDEVKKIVGRVRGYLPGSNARWGPLSDLDRSGEALPQTLADGMDSTAEDPVGTIEEIVGKIKSKIREAQEQQAQEETLTELGSGDSGMATGSGQKVEVDARIMPGAVKVLGGLTEEARQEVLEMMEGLQDEQIREIQRLFGASAIR